MKPDLTTTQADAAHGSSADPGRLHRAVLAVPSMAVGLPWLIRARWLLGRTPDVRLLLARHDMRPVRYRRTRPAPESLRRGVERSLRIVGPKVDGCVPRSLALFALLSRHGYPATFVSGVQRCDGQVRGHAWVLLDDAPLEGPAAQEDPRTRQLLAAFREQLRFDNETQRLRRRLDAELR
jgi:hypothetical protein